MEGQFGYKYHFSWVSMKPFTVIFKYAFTPYVSLNRTYLVPLFSGVAARWNTEIPLFPQLVVEIRKRKEDNVVYGGV